MNKVAIGHKKSIRANEKRIRPPGKLEPSATILSYRRYQEGVVSPKPSAERVTS